MKGFLARISVNGEEVGEDYALDSVPEFFVEERSGRRYRVELTDAPKGAFSTWAWSVYQVPQAATVGPETLVARIRHQRPQWLGHPYDYTREPEAFMTSGGQGTLWNTVQALVE